MCLTRLSIYLPHVCHLSVCLSVPFLSTSCPSFYNLSVYLTPVCLLTLSLAACLVSSSIHPSRSSDDLNADRIWLIISSACQTDRQTNDEAHPQRPLEAGSTAAALTMALLLVWKVALTKRAPRAKPNVSSVFPMQVCQRGVHDCNTHRKHKLTFYGLKYESPEIEF